ncbi:MAG: apolipoprotein N-acyltransferase, partial [Mycobacteriales bacterium]
DARSAWFRWAHLNTDDLAGTAAEAGLAVHDRWTVASRWFAELRSSSSRRTSVAGSRSTGRCGLRGAGGRWRAARAGAEPRVLAALDDDGGLPQSYGGDPRRRDAAALMAVVFGLLHGADPRAVRLVDVTLAELSAGPFVYRYPPGPDDGFAGQEGAFVPVSWWAVSALAATGRYAEALARAEALDAVLPPLIPEEMDPVEHRPLGNTPLLWSYMEAARALYHLDVARLRRRYGCVGLLVWRVARYLRLRSAGRAPREPPTVRQTSSWVGCAGAAILRSMTDRRLRVSLPLALLAGLATYGAFPPLDIWPLAAIGPALLLVALGGSSLRRAALLGLGYGAAVFSPLLSWLVNVGVVPYLGLAAVETLIGAVLAVALRLSMRVRWWPLGAAAVWVGVEAVRDRVPYGGFPWGRLAFSQADSPALGWSAVGGAPLVSFLVALVAALLAWLALSSSWRSARMPAAVLAGAAVLAASGAALPTSGTPHGQLRVAVVQGNVPRSTDVAEQQRKLTVLRNHVQANAVLADRVRSGKVAAPDLVVWPENATDLDPGNVPLVHDLIAGAVADIGRPTLVGAVLDAPNHHIYNAGQLWLPGTGVVQTYVKRRLVPFGEYIPLRDLLAPIIPQIKLVPRDFAPGHAATVFDVAGAHVADVICYEIAFDGLVRASVRAGADLLVEQTNDASFTRDGQLGETRQQLAMARLRAVEHRRSVVVASTSGISAVIAPDGVVVAETPVFTQRELVRTVPLITASTLADRVGAWPDVRPLCAWVGSDACRVAASSPYAARGGRRRGPCSDGGRRLAGVSPLVVPGPRRAVSVQCGWSSTSDQVRVANTLTCCSPGCTVSSDWYALCACHPPLPPALRVPAMVAALGVTLVRAGREGVGRGLRRLARLLADVADVTFLAAGVMEGDVPVTVGVQPTAGPATVTVEVPGPAGDAVAAERSTDGESAVPGAGSPGPRPPAGNGAKRTGKRRSGTPGGRH